MSTFASANVRNGKTKKHRNISQDWSFYHFEVLSSALGAVEVAGEKHLVDVVASAVVELQHVEGSWLEIVKVGFDLQALQDTFLHKMQVFDLIPAQTDKQMFHSL